MNQPPLISGGPKNLEQCIQALSDLFGLLPGLYASADSKIQLKIRQAVDTMITKMLHNSSPRIINKLFYEEEKIIMLRKMKTSE